VWRKKAQFDEGSGTVEALDCALAKLINGPLTRESENNLYGSILREAYVHPDRILAAAGSWTSDRVDVR
jgi:asparagine synthase (glutamine-hydrolysing)